MILKSLRIIGFRNQIKSNYSFFHRKNLIYGANGAGKTSILEAIFLLSFGKSFLRVNKSEIINHNHSHFFICSKVKSRYGDNEISMFFREKTDLLLNQKKTRIIDVNSYLYSLFFSSADYTKYIENYLHIRKLINRFIFGLEPLYLHNILSYNKSLRQKNRLLKKEIKEVELNSWNRLICEHSESIVKTRMNFVNKLNSIIKDNFQKDLKIIYSPSFEVSKGISRSSFYEQIKNKISEEQNRKRSLLGTHLDKFTIFLKGRNLKYNSSGEKKLYLLLIYIAMLHYFYQIKGEYPVFLLDDFDSAVDKKGLEFLVGNFPDLQIIASSVNKSNTFDNIIEVIKEN